MKKHVICLFDENGVSAMEWQKNGYQVYCYDLLHTDVFVRDGIIFCPWDATDEDQVNNIINRHLGKAAIVLGFPPCTDLAVSGAAWFKSKFERDPTFQSRAVAMCRSVEFIGHVLGVPWVLENPVSVLSTMWRKPDHIFHPWEYGGYLPTDDVHPKYPKYIAPRDAYTKRTCYWTGMGFVMPPKDEVKPEEGYSRQHRLLGGKSARTKSIRSCSPRGIAKAIYRANG
jgi:hypothetical protein